MLSKQIQEDVANSSAIRAMFTEGMELAKRVGSENVYDFSLGNPVTPVPEAFTQAMLDIIEEEKDTTKLHGYMDNAGYPEVRSAIAKHLNKRFGVSLNQRNIIMTVGAAGAINVILKTIIDPGDEMAVFAPYFTEYRNYIGNWRGNLVTIDPDYETFQPDFEDLKRKISPKTKALIINNPVNPTGVVYSEETIKKIAAILEEKQREYGHEIYIISDEPYRELIYDGLSTVFLTKYYANTFVTYSFSKSLSLPGERIGYMVIPDEMADFDAMIAALTIANRICGFINAPSLMQKAVARCLDEKTDVEFYNRNRKALYEMLTELGFECVYPQGTFYLFVKSPTRDEKAFVEAGKRHHIMMVNGTTFHCPGYVRLAYCVQPEVIEHAKDAFAALAKEYNLKGKKS
ncbi:pyridoxal phosphate-dependent aminotransferase [Eubacterium oxidoreducens]|uniref:Aminotransferase n=1 Tax=Eubacterium oxidoreducens TaxID=1732 RepID=A0A1G6C0G4_EUBOX|nr:pyridoxal phosphate-dependent aminotransferase [Eubacterium oxidoreducens]SDB26352.1 aspartate aminotransferase [Eubacterium oxidoreducens]